MQRNKIFIEALPFEEFLRAANETIGVKSVESTGCVFGRYFEGNSYLRWVIEAVHPIQLAKRSSQQIKFDDFDDLEKATLCLSNDLIGGYHSHVFGKRQVNGKKEELVPIPSLSPDDKDQIKESVDKTLATLNQRNEDDTEISLDELPPYLEIILNVHKRKRTSKLSNKNPLLISGYLENPKGIFRINFAGHYYDPREKRFRRAVIQAPSKLVRMIS